MDISNVLTRYSEFEQELLFGHGPIKDRLKAASVFLALINPDDLPPETFRENWIKLDEEIQSHASEKLVSNKLGTSIDKMSEVEAVSIAKKFIQLFRDIEDWQHDPATHL